MAGNSNSLTADPPLRDVKLVLLPALLLEPGLPADAAEDADRASLISLARSAFFRSDAYSEAS